MDKLNSAPRSQQPNTQPLNHEGLCELEDRMRRRIAALLQYAEGKCNSSELPICMLAAQIRSVERRAIAENSDLSASVEETMFEAVIEDENRSELYLLEDAISRKLGPKGRTKKPTLQQMFLERERAKDALRSGALDH